MLRRDRLKHKAPAQGSQRSSGTCQGWKSGSTDRPANTGRISVGLGGQFQYRTQYRHCSPVLFTAGPTAEECWGSLTFQGCCRLGFLTGFPFANLCSQGPSELSTLPMVGLVWKKKKTKKPIKLSKPYKIIVLTSKTKFSYNSYQSMKQISKGLLTADTCSIFLSQ